ncbi:MAG: YIEGIA domain-containing protein [Tumebacillaceae bacterium]
MAGLLSHEFLSMICTGFLVGTFSRITTIKTEQRQYPSHPNGSLIHVVTGMVAAIVGSIFLPAVLTKNFVAVSFLALTMGQLRDVRKMEKSSLDALEKTEFVPRGSAYIDGIAKTFEARNYIALLTSAITTLTMHLIPGHHNLLDIPGGVIVGLLLLWVLRRLSKGKTVGDIADIRIGALHFKGNDLYVEDLRVTNIGLPDVQERFATEGVGVIVTPHDTHARIALANDGQRQAIEHEAARTLGLKGFHYKQRDFDSGRLCFALIPIHQNNDDLLRIIRHVPLLESTKKSERMRNPEILPGGGGN